MNSTLRFNFSSSLFASDYHCCVITIDPFDACLLDNEAFVSVPEEE